MSREYPSAPIAAVGVVVVREDGRILLARRANPPSAGMWSLPGGRLELGETVAECARREVLEECGVHCEPLELHHAVDSIHRDAAGRVQYHYLIVDVLARWTSGDPRPGADASEVAWFRAENLGEPDVTPRVAEVVEALLARLHN